MQGVEKASYQAPAMEFSKYWVLARFQVLGYEDCNVDALVVDLFVGSSKDFEAFKACFGCSIVKRGHDNFYRI